jgi:hypothetical protein
MFSAAAPQIGQFMILSLLRHRHYCERLGCGALAGFAKNGDPLGTESVLAKWSCCSGTKGSPAEAGLPLAEPV